MLQSQLLKHRISQRLAAWRLSLSITQLRCAGTIFVTLLGNPNGRWRKPRPWIDLGFDPGFELGFDPDSSLHSTLDSSLDLTLTRPRYYRCVIRLGAS